MLWSIDSCQNWVSTDQYHRTASQSRESTHRGRVFFDVIRWQVTSFQLIAGSSKFFKLCMTYVVFMSLWLRTIKILMSNGPRTQKFSQLFKIQAGKTFFFHGHVLRLIFILWLVKIWQFVRKIYAGSWNLFTLTDEVFCQLLMFLTVFLHWMIYNDIQCKVKLEMAHDEQSLN